MFCEKCGSQFSLGAKFCGSCGMAAGETIQSGIPNAIPTKQDAQATIKCGNCDYTGPGEPARSWFGVVLAWLCVIFAPIITIIYFLGTSKYRCPKCKSTFVGVKNKEGVFSGKGGGSRILLWVVGILLGIALLGIMASIVLVSLSSAREKAKEAAFKAQVTSIIPAAILACDERNIIQKDLVGYGEQQYFDVVAVKNSLRQSCGKDGAGTFSFTVNGIGDYVQYSAKCADTGCNFQSDGQAAEVSNNQIPDTSSENQNTQITARVNDKTTIGDYQVSINGVVSEDGVEADRIHRKLFNDMGINIPTINYYANTQKIAVVNFSIKNLSQSKVLRFDPKDFILISKNGYSMKHISPIRDYGQVLIGGDIRPGMTAQGWYAYEIPKGLNEGSEMLVNLKFPEMKEVVVVDVTIP